MTTLVESHAPGLEGYVELCESQRQTVMALQAEVDHQEAARQERERARTGFAAEARASAAVVLGLLGPLVSDNLPSEVLDALVRSSRQVAHLRDLIEQYVDRPDPGISVSKAELFEVPVADVLADVVDAAFADFVDRPVVCTAPAGMVVRTAPSRLHFLLLEIVSQAADRTSSSSTIEIEVVPILWAVAFVVSDRGPGVSEGFDVAVSGEDCSHLARQITASLGGQLQISDREGGGRVVRIVLPQRRADDPTRGGSSR